MPSDFARRLGQAIASRRKAAGLTQEQLAERASTSSEWVSQVERGVGNPSIGLLDAVATALGTTSSEVVRLAFEPYADRPDVREFWLIVERLSPRDIEVLRATAEALARPRE